MNFENDSISDEIGKSGDF